MNKVGHFVGGVAMTTTYYWLNKVNLMDTKVILDNVLITGGIVVGAFLPDLDAEYSTIKSKLKIIGKIFGKIQNILPSNPITNHRGALLHSFWTLVPFIYWHDINVVLGIGLGVLSHHILDMMTPAGLRYFYPYKTKINIWR